MTIEPPEGRHPIPSVRVQLFGGLRVESPDSTITSVPVGRSRDLLAYLLLEPGVPHGRERLAETLWPDEPFDRAGRTLTGALYRLRQSLGRGWVKADRTSVRLTPHAGLSVDVWDFERLAAANTTESLAEAVTVYAGELLPEIYDDWIAARRASLADSYRTALATLAEDAEAHGMLVDAFRYYHWLTAADPLDEVGHRGLMRAYLRSGHPAAAIQQYERLSVLLRRELDIEPSDESRRLGEAARRETTGGAERLPDPPFVGRRRERAAVLTVLDGAVTGSALVLIEGDPGIGKSRLLAVLADDARWRGFQVVRGRSDEARPNAPYAPLDEALGETLSHAVIGRLRGRLAPATLDVLESMVPAMAERLPTPGGVGVGPLATERPNLAAGLGAFFAELTRERPWLIVLDDVHNAGPAFWDSLSFLSESEGGRVVIVLAYRANELRSNPAAWAALRRLDAAMAPLRVQLGGLSLDESRALSRALHQSASEEELAELQRMSGGNPLVMQQALAAGPQVRSGQPGFGDLLDRRLAGLSPAARRAVEAAAVLGSAFSFVEWLGVSQPGPPGALDEVVAARLVIEQPDHYELEHDLVREHVYAAIPDRRRALLHRRAAAVLGRARAPSAVLARHFDRGGQARRAIIEYHRAADEAFAGYAYGTALDHVQRALALSARNGGEAMALHTLRHRLLGLMLRVDEWREALATAEKIATRIGDRQALIEVLEGRLSLHTLDGDLRAMEAAGERALQLSRAVGDEQVEARLLATLGWHVSESMGDNRRALPMLRRAVRLATNSGDSMTHVAALCSMSSALRSIGRCRAAHISATRALAAVETRGHLYRGRPHALAELAESVLELGRWQEAREAMRWALAGYRQVEDPWSYGSALFGLVNVCAGMGQGQEAIAAAEELVALSVRLGLPATSDYGVWHRVSLARAHISAGDVDSAARVINEVRTVAPQAVRPRIALAGVIGQLAFEQGESADAVEYLETAYQLWHQTAEPRDAAVAFWLAIAGARSGNHDRAQVALSRGLAALSVTDMERHDALAALARFEVTSDRGALADARAVITRQAARFDDETLRTTFENDVPVHRLINERWRQHGPTASGVMVRLTKRDVPLGRRIRDDERVEVVWSLDEWTATDESAVQRRRHHLVRLVDEARAAGAVPTDEQLAAALGVSRRTILRDAKALAGQRRTLHTRRRRA